MDDVVSTLPQPHDHPLLRRRSSIPSSILIAPTKLDLLHHSSNSSSTSATTSSSSDDLELLSIKPNSHSYTSLKDLLPTAAVNSPRSSSATLQGGSDICIRNRLVKQAAWAYLQPMSTSPGSAEGSFLHLILPRFAAFFDLVRRTVVRFLDWTVRVMWIWSSR